MSSRAATEWRYEKLAWPEINDAVELDKVCILPCGAVEQHGPHLPLDVDLVRPTEIARGAGPTGAAPAAGPPPAPVRPPGDGRRDVPRGDAPGGPVAAPSGPAAAEGPAPRRATERKGHPPPELAASSPLFYA